MAAPLGLIRENSPDIMSSFIDVSYDSGTDAFSATGFALTLVDDVDSHDFDGGFGGFSLFATIDSSGAAAAGSLSITGSVDVHSGPTLLTGDLVDFGWVDGTTDLYEFVFEVTGGDLATPAFYGTAGSTFGVIFTSIGTTFGAPDYWDDSFGSSGSSFSDTATLIPEPSSLVILGLGAFALLRRSRG